MLTISVTAVSRATISLSNVLQAFAGQPVIALDYAGNARSTHSFNAC